MRISFVLLLTIAIFCSTPVFSQEEDTRQKDTQYSNKPEREEWLKDSGFGMFVHFGIDSQLGMVISHSLVGASEDYVNRYLQELPESFNPSEFDPEKIAKLARLAGMKYIVFTTKHHSGFCMWDTKTTDFNIMNTPYGKDLVEEYVEATREQGLGVGFYYSPEDFKFLHEKGITISRRQFKEEITPAIKEEYHDLIRSQIQELFTNYGKIDVLFLDGTYEEPAKNTAWKLQPDVLITRGALETPEQTIPGKPLAETWETCMTLGTQWQFKPTNEQYKEGTRMIEILSDIRSKGGALLLNIGPKPGGEIPSQQENVLREMAAWNFINRECIYRVRPWIVPNEGDIIFTRAKNSNTVYAILTNQENWTFGARKKFVLKSLSATDSTEVSVLGQNDRVVEYQTGKNPETRFEQTQKGLAVSCVRAQRIYNNRKWPNPLVLKLGNIEPALVPPDIHTVQVDGDAKSIELRIDDLGDQDKLKLSYLYRPYAGFVEELYQEGWKKGSNTITIDQPGVYTISIPEKLRGVHQFRAAALHPSGVNIKGNVKRANF